MGSEIQISYNFYVSQNIIPLFFPTIFKYVKGILRSQATLKQVDGQIWTPRASFADPWNRVAGQGGRLSWEGDIQAETRVKIKNEPCKDRREDHCRYKGEWCKGLKEG